MKTDKPPDRFTRRQFPDNGKWESDEKPDDGFAPKAEFMLSRLGTMLFNHQRVRYRWQLESRSCRQR